MLTMYHLEGGRPRPHPLLRHGESAADELARAAGTDPVELRFDFAGGANVDPATDMHMHAGRMTLRGADRIEAEWAVYDKGKQAGANKFFLDRVKTAAQRP